MSEPAPKLDVLSFEQLRDALLARIPVHAPEWTDHDVSDPGVTLLELFAFLADDLASLEERRSRRRVGDGQGRSRAVGGTAGVPRGRGAEGSIRSRKD